MTIDCIKIEWTDGAEKTQTTYLLPYPGLRFYHDGLRLRVLDYDGPLYIRSNVREVALVEIQR